MMHLAARSRRPARPGYWFAPRRYGIGAVPAAWQGWAATFGFIALIGAGVGLAPTDLTRTAIAVPIIVGYLVLVRAKTDGEWRWRWGDGEERR